MIPVEPVELEMLERGLGKIKRSVRNEKKVPKQHHRHGRIHHPHRWIVRRDLR